VLPCPEVNRAQQCSLVVFFDCGEKFNVVRVGAKEGGAVAQEKGCVGSLAVFNGVGGGEDEVAVVRWSKVAGRGDGCDGGGGGQSQC
jgi:hypothetical protein